jgi:hypothetical protein
MRRHGARAALSALLLLGLWGCFNPFNPRIAPTQGVYIPPPAPNSPQGVIRLFEWCWKNRDISLYKEIFTADFHFYFANGDSAGNRFRDPWVTREEELNIARNLFVGGGSAPPASSIYLNLDPTLNPQPDSRPGKNRKWHQEILTSVDLTINVEGSNTPYRIMGNARFFVVRGDSALIPTDLGFKSDSTRWYVDQWNDETLQGAGNAAQRAAVADRARAPVPIAITSLRPRRPAAPRTTPLVPEQVITWGFLDALYQH